MKDLWLRAMNGDDEAVRQLRDLTQQRFDERFPETEWYERIVLWWDMSMAKMLANARGL